MHCQFLSAFCISIRCYLIVFVCSKILLVGKYKILIIAVKTQFNFCSLLAKKSIFTSDRSCCLTDDIPYQAKLILLVLCINGFSPLSAAFLSSLQGSSNTYICLAFLHKSLYILLSVFFQNQIQNNLSIKVFRNCNSHIVLVRSQGMTCPDNRIFCHTGINIGFTICQIFCLGIFYITGLAFLLVHSLQLDLAFHRSLNRLRITSCLTKERLVFCKSYHLFSVRFQNPSVLDHIIKSFRILIQVSISVTIKAFYLILSQINHRTALITESAVGTAVIGSNWYGNLRRNDSGCHISKLISLRRKCHSIHRACYLILIRTTRSRLSILGPVIQIFQSCIDKYSNIEICYCMISLKVYIFSGIPPCLHLQLICRICRENNI